MPLAPMRSLGSTLLGVLVASLVAACGGSVDASFDPGGRCTSDGKRPGAYPELEARIPGSFDGRPPTRLDSGRNCGEGSLGTLASHGIDELRFAGGLWETGARSGVTIAVFSASGLTMARLAEFYETGARGAPKTEAIATSDYAAGDASGRRLDTLNDESFQTIVVLDGPEPDLVNAVLVANDIREVGTREAHEGIVAEATEAALAP